MTREDSDRLARIEVKLDTVLEQVADHEKRIRNGERRQHVYAGGVGIVAFIAAKVGLPFPVK